MPLVTSTQIPQTGIVQLNDTVEPVAPIDHVTITEPNYTTTVTNLQWLGETDLTTLIEGSSWVVTYYSQILTRDSSTSGQQVSASGLYQSYKKINELELKVSTPLSTTQDEDTKMMRVTGSAMLYPGTVIPNEGDIFIAPIGAGKTGYFRILSSIKKSIFKRACYEIDYSLTTDHAWQIEELEARVVNVFYYQKDFASYGRDPMITEGDYTSLMALYAKRSTLVSSYVREFFSDEYSTFLVPKQGEVVYDPFLVKYLSLIIRGEPGKMGRMQQFSLDDHWAYQSTCLWDALAQRSEELLNGGFTTAGLVTREWFSATSYSRNVYYSGARLITYPLDVGAQIDQDVGQGAKSVSLIKLAPTVVTTTWVEELTARQNALRGVQLYAPDNDYSDTIHPVGLTDHYVLSENFYSETVSQSRLEDLVTRYLRQGPIEPQVLMDMVQLCAAWPALERFYYIPILLTLIDATVLRS